MTFSWLIANVLWLSLALLMASSLTSRRSLSGAGWFLFGMHWLKQPSHYLMIGDYFNVGLSILAALFSLYMSWIILAKGCSSPSCDWASLAVAIGGVLYFPFAQLTPLGDWLISQTAHLTAMILEGFSVPILVNGANTMSLNGHTVQIILACTAIESMALFAGVIIAVKAPTQRKLMAFMVSVPTIYMLNLFRNVFVVLAYGNQWFGPDSFYLAHNVVAKAGSTVALFLIAYGVFALLPEMLDVIDELARVIRRPGGEET